MDPGDIAYLIFLALFAVANLLRKRKKTAEEGKPEPQPRKQGSRPEPPPRRQAEPPPRRQPAEERSARQPRASRPQRQTDPEVGSEDEDPMKRILEDLFGPRETSPTPPAEPKVAPRQQAPPPRESRDKSPKQKPRIPVAKGYREGESFESYVKRTRQEARTRMIESLEAQQKEFSRSSKVKQNTFDLRRAIINDAILNRPYR
jgi:hypothetical protein